MKHEDYDRIENLAGKFEATKASNDTMRKHLRQKEDAWLKKLAPYVLEVLKNNLSGKDPENPSERVTEAILKSLGKRITIPEDVRGYGITELMQYLQDLPISKEIADSVLYWCSEHPEETGVEEDYLDILGPSIYIFRFEKEKPDS